MLIIVLILCLLIILAGLVSIIFPFLPSIPVIWLGIFLYAAATSFEKITEGFIAIMALLMIAVVILDYVTMVSGLREYKASFWGIVGAVIGGYIGSLVNLVIGLILGALFGAIIAEILSGQDLAFAFRTKKYTIIGFFAGTSIKIAVGVTIAGLFIWKITQ